MARPSLERMPASSAPERWLLEKDEKKMSEMNRTHELIFGYGKYQCLGKPIALMEISKVVFEVRLLLP
jgi:hypothetical protein